MARTILEQKKIQRYLIAALVAVMFITAVVLWLGFFKKTPAAPASGGAAGIPMRTIDIDTRLFENPIFDILRSPREAVRIPESVGRENPFVK
ncbi:MAG: hypothetical protein HY482_02490 [Candidatus Wildermuthbacteria bacterium]|nr:hypothetical protein [Candidatus Wildermuthbacteria bacterium]